MESSVEDRSTLLESLLLPLIPIEASHPPLRATVVGIQPLIEVAKMSEMTP